MLVWFCFCFRSSEALILSEGGGESCDSVTGRRCQVILVMHSQPGVAGEWEAKVRWGIVNGQHRPGVRHGLSNLDYE